MDVGCPIFIGFPDDLIDELNDGGFLIKIAQILFQEVAFIIEVEWVVFHHLIEGFSAYTVEFTGGFGDIVGDLKEAERGGQ